MNSNYKIRQMTPKDLPLVLQIEKQVKDHPWEESLFQQCLSAGYRGFVLIVENEMVGYTLVTFAAGELQILNIAVSGDRQRKGYDGRLLQHVIALSIEDDVKRIFLEVRVSNVSAFQLYKKFGFKQIGVREGYYTDGDNKEDALVLEKILSQSMT